MDYKFVILDLDNTLYGYDKPHNLAIANVFSNFSKDFELPLSLVKDTFTKARKQTHLELPNRAASHNRLLYFQKMLELNNLNSLEHALKYYNLYWDTFLEHIQLFDRVLDFLESGRRHGVKTCILTDLTAHIQYRKIRRLELFQYIDFMVTSEEVGVEKPHPSMFLKALGKLGSNMENTLMIGDSWEKDIVGASSLNIECIWINHKKVNREIPKGIEQVSHFGQIVLL